jgi:hypothetical protein
MPTAVLIHKLHEESKASTQPTSDPVYFVRIVLLCSFLCAVSGETMRRRMITIMQVSLVLELLYWGLTVDDSSWTACLFSMIRFGVLAIVLLDAETFERWVNREQIGNLIKQISSLIVRLFNCLCEQKRVAAPAPAASVKRKSSVRGRSPARALEIQRSKELLLALKRGRSPARHTAVHRNAAECSVCIMKRDLLAIVPCGHKCVCEPCSQRVIAKDNQCPICRNSITTCIQVYDP